MSFRLKVRSITPPGLDSRALLVSVARRLFPWNPTIHAGDIGLGSTRLRVFSSGASWIGEQKVQDGLGRLGDFECLPGSREGQSAAGPAVVPYVRGADLVATFRSRIGELSIDTRITVKHHEPIAPPVVQSLKFRQPDSGMRIRSLCLIQSAGQVFSGGARFLVVEPGIHDGTRRMRFYPHTRRSVVLSDISLPIRESFLREAEALKRISRQNGELIGVFRNVPVSMISRIRYLEPRALILYTLDYTQPQSRVRVHDLAAIRNPEDRTTHLVPHRTRYRTAFLG